MTTLIALTRMMESYNHAVAPTRECAAWRLFIEECSCDLHRLPWSDDADCYVPEGFAQYWSLVATGESAGFRREERRLFSRRVKPGEKHKYCPSASSRRPGPVVRSPALVRRRVAGLAGA